MMNRIRCSLALLALLSVAQADDYPNRNLLVEPSELAAERLTPRPIILDARSRQKYSAGHARLARCVDAGDWAKSFDANEAAAWCDKIGSLGVDGSVPVVVYDDNLCKDAARVWWILRYWGVPDVRLLNGGWSGWTQAKGPVAAGESPPVVAATFLAKPAPKRFATKDQVLQLIQSGGSQVIDVRSEGEFCGIDTLTNRRGGAIPGARHLEWSELLDKDSGRFQPADVLQRRFREAGVDLHSPSVTHCQSGGRASVMAFGIELLGGETANYYRGWSEWGNADDTPIERHEPAPK